MTIIHGQKTFTKQDANTFQTEAVECPDCGFEFGSGHDLSDEPGRYGCPNCGEDELITEFNTLEAYVESQCNYYEEKELEERKANGHSDREKWFAAKLDVYNDILRKMRKTSPYPSEEENT